jgi:hypothetical protein
MLRKVETSVPSLNPGGFTCSRSLCTEVLMPKTSQSLVCCDCICTYFGFDLFNSFTDYLIIKSPVSNRSEGKIEATKELDISSWIAFHGVEHRTPNVVGSNKGNKNNQSK